MDEKIQEVKEKLIRLKGEIEAVIDRKKLTDITFDFDKENSVYKQIDIISNELYKFDATYEATFLDNLYSKLNKLKRKLYVSIDNVAVEDWVYVERCVENLIQNRFPIKDVLLKLNAIYIKYDG